MAKERDKWPFTPVIKEIDDRLLPCPFCGSQAYLGFRPVFNQWFAMCAGPGCGVYMAQDDKDAFPTHMAAIASWNRRWKSS